MKLPERLAKARAKAGLTQRDLAKKLGVPASTVAGWETGANGISKGRLPDVARVLKLDLMELLG